MTDVFHVGWADTFHYYFRLIIITNIIIIIIIIIIILILISVCFENSIKISIDERKSDGTGQPGKKLLLRLLTRTLKTNKCSI